MSLSGERDRGAKADALLRDPLLLEVLQSLRDSYISEWSQSDIADKDKREQVFFLLHALTAFEDQLKSISQSGKLASLQIENSVH